MAEPDFGKIDRNLDRLFKAKAPQRDVESYLASEGVSADQVAQWKQGRRQNRTAFEGWVNSAIDGVSDAATGAYNMVVGKQDPRFSGLKSIEDASGIIDPNAEMFGVSDAAYGDIYKKTLGDRYLGSFKDANGYEIIRFRGKDGKEQQAYVNRPGLDWQDVNRGVSSALPYMAAAGGLGMAARGAGMTGTLSNAFLQGGGAAVTSGVQDVVASRMGSEQPLDTTRALVAGGLGAGGEIIGRVVLPFIRRAIGDRSIVTANGTLTAKGRRLVQREGLDPDLVDQELAKEIQRRATVANDPVEAITQAHTDRFGIPTTKGQRTKDPQLLLTEKDIRYGTLGDRAKQSLQNLDDAQAEAIRRGALGDDAAAGPASSPQSVATRIAPERSTTEFSPDVLGRGARGGLDAASRQAKNIENQAWSLTENIVPRQGAFKTLPDFIRNRRGAMRIDDKLTPTAYRMSEDLQAYVSGGANITPEAPEILGQQSVRYIDEMRRRLLGMKDAAAPGQDSAAANAIYKAFDDWMMDAADKGMLSGRPGAVLALRNARNTTRELRGILAPRVAGKKTAAARILEKVKDADTGEEALSALIGSTGPKAQASRGSVEALRSYKVAAFKLGGEAGKQAWNDVRLAYWLKLVTDKKGDLLSPQQIVTAINTSFKNRPSMMKVLYDAGDRKLMQQYAQAVKAATYKDPNPPSSGTAVRALFPTLVKEQLEVQSKRELFSKHNVLMSRLYRALAKVVPNVLDGKNVAGSAAASRATSQQLTRRVAPSVGGYGAASAPAVNRLLEQPRE